MITNNYINNNNNGVNNSSAKLSCLGGLAQEPHCSSVLKASIMIKLYCF